MKYKLIQKGMPAKPEAGKKWYAIPTQRGNVTQKTLAKEIASRSSLTAGDVANVIQNLLELIPAKLTEGNSVQLGDMGRFRLSFSSEGVKDAENFNTDKIRKIKVLFTPSPEFKRTLSDIKFEIEK